MYSIIWLELVDDNITKLSVTMGPNVQVTFVTLSQKSFNQTYGIKWSA